LPYYSTFNFLFLFASVFNIQYLYQIVNIIVKIYKLMLALTVWQKFLVIMHAVQGSVT